MIRSAGCTYQVTNPKAPFLAADPKIRRIANAIRQTVEAESPRDTGLYAGSWEVTRVRPATYWVSNRTPYGRYVEYGTRHMRARPVLGRVVAAVRAQVGR